MEYRREIDGLRAVAVVPVILFHGGFAPFSGGYVGVDVFFVISGYLITTLILEAMAQGRFTLAGFYTRRARRILPALLFMVLCCLPFAWLLLLPDDMEDFAASLFGVALFVSNIIFKTQSGYFETAAELKPLLHTWSLAVEEQFYILFPLLVLALRRFGSAFLPGLLVVLFLASLGYAHWASVHEPETAFYFLAARIWEMLAGSLVAIYLMHRPVRVSAGLGNAGSALGLALILGSIIGYDATTPFSSLYALAPVGGAVLIILFAREGTFVHAVLSLRALVAVGLISYSLYLWHQPVFAFYRVSGLPQGPWVTLLLLAVIVLAAVVSWRFVEQPFRHGRARARRVLGISASALAGLAAIAVIAFVTNDRHSALRFSERDLALIASADKSPKRDACHYDAKDRRFAVDEACVYFGSDPSWVVYGNSYGVELAFALAQALEARGESLVHHTISGCLAAYGLETRPHCADFFRSRLDSILADAGLRHVVLAFRTDTAGADSARSLVALANDIAATGRQVYLLLHQPVLPRDVRFYIGASRLSQSAGIAGTREAWLASNADFYSALAGLSPDVRRIDLVQAFCGETLCHALRDGKALYFDGHHMSVSGARLAVAQILK